MQMGRVGRHQACFRHWWHGSHDRAEAVLWRHGGQHCGVIVVISGSVCAQIDFRAMRYVR